MRNVLKGAAVGLAGAVANGLLLALAVSAGSADTFKTAVDTAVLTAPISAIPAIPLGVLMGWTLGRARRRRVLIALSSVGLAFVLMLFVFAFAPANSAIMGLFLPISLFPTVGMSLVIERWTRVVPADLDPISLLQMPEVDAIAKCTLPVLVANPEALDFPGVAGSCFAVRHQGRVLFLTAAHVAKPAEHAKVDVGVGFGPEHGLCPIGGMTVPIPAEGAEDGLDFAVMFPAKEPQFVPGQSHALDIANVADMNAVPPGALLAVLGYPRNHPLDEGTDYDQRTIDSVLWHGLGKYQGPSSLAGMHVATLDSAGVGGPQGMSGGAVIRVFHKKRRWSGVLAGLVATGGDRVVHFIDVRTIIGFLNKEWGTLQALAANAMQRGSGSRP